MQPVGQMSPSPQSPVSKAPTYNQNNLLDVKGALMNREYSTQTLLSKNTSTTKFESNMASNQSLVISPKFRFGIQRNKSPSVLNNN